jgi:hypothetical protein
MILIYILLCAVFVILLIRFLLHCVEIHLSKKNSKQLESNLNQYKNTIAGGLAHDRIREKRKTQ